MSEIIEDLYPGYITDVGGIKVGHAQDLEAKTGLTVIVPPKGNTCGVEVRGGAPGTRETDLLKPQNQVSEVDSVILSGGSAYGLAASVGVMEALEEEGRGMDVGCGVVPIIPQAVLFDLSYGNPKVRPDKEMGKRAYLAATFEEKRQGIVGAGTGATVGKILGMESCQKSGLGSASYRVGDLVVGAIVAVNALGDIFDYERGLQIGGVQKEGEFLGTLKLMEKMATYSRTMTNTTIGLVATNASFNKTDLTKIAQMTHNGYARSIVPVHTLYDGDTIFSLATNQIQADINLVGALSSKVMSRAIANAIYASKNWGKK